MGWTFVEREKGHSHRDWFQEHVFGDCARILDISASRGVAFAAVLVAPEDREPYVMAEVILYQWRPRRQSYLNFGYKAMSETSQPGVYSCPERILDLLSPVDAFAEPGTAGHEYASEWRRLCREYHERRRGLRKLRRGDVLEFKESIHYGKRWGSHSRFVITDPRRNLARPVGVSECDYRLPADWRDRDFTVLEHASAGGR